MDATVTREDIAPSEIRLRHDVDSDRVSALVNEMDASGWAGRPVVLYRDTERDCLCNITGCHRISAAIESGIDVPAIIITPNDPEALDAVEFAASVDDIEAGMVVARIDPSLRELVEQG